MLRSFSVWMERFVAKIRIKGSQDGSVVDVMDTTTGCKRRRDRDNEYELIFSRKILDPAEELG